MTLIANPTDFLTGHATLDAQPPPAREDHTSADHIVLDAQTRSVGGTRFPGGHPVAENRSPDATGDTNHLTGQGVAEAQSTDAREATTSPAAIDGPETAAITLRGEPTSDQPASARSISNGQLLADPSLALTADLLDDIEGLRKANENRYRILTTIEADSDGEIRGFGLDPDHPGVTQLRTLIDQFAKVEKDTIKVLEKNMRNHPLGPWVKSQKGIGEKTVARLLGKIGDPYINAATGQPRTVSQLWAYCGLHVINDTAARRQKGQQANWSTPAKTRAWLCVTSACPKILDSRCRADDHLLDIPGTVRWHEPNCECSPYRVVMDARRAHTAVTHPDWTPGHSKNDAERVATKQFLKDLWIEARRIHSEAQV